jgi:hypothetical protein
MYKPSRPHNLEELGTAEGLGLVGGERGENVPVKLAILYVRFAVLSCIKLRRP